MAEPAAVLLGVVFLHIFYRAISAKWPTSYYSIGTKTDQTISNNLIAYLLFRFGPIYLTCIFVGAVLTRREEPVIWPVVLIAGIHALLTSGRALLGLLWRGHARQRPLVTTLHVAVLLLATLVGVLAAMTGPRFKEYVPDGGDLTVTLWTALFAGVVGAFLLHVVSVSEPDTYAALGASRSRIPDDLWAAAEGAANDVNAEPRLVHAFMLVENMQRPQWTRRLERAAGRLLGRGTYGPLQVKASKPQGDLEALRNAIRVRFTGRFVPRYESEWGGPQPDRRWLEFFARSYNPDESYVRDVGTAYDWIEHPSTVAIASTDAQADDNLPQIELYEFSSAAGNLTLAGRAASDAEIAIRLVDSNWVETYNRKVSLNGGASRYRVEWRVSVDVPNETANVQVWAGSTTCPTAADRVITLPVQVV